MSNLFLLDNTSVLDLFEIKLNDFENALFAGAAGVGVVFYFIINKKKQVV